MVEERYQILIRSIRAGTSQRYANGVLERIKAASERHEEVDRSNRLTTSLSFLSSFSLNRYCLLHGVGREAQSRTPGVEDDVLAP